LNAFAAYDQAIRLADRSYGEIPAVAPAYIGLSDILLEWNHLEDALGRAQRAIELSRQGGDHSALILGYLALARVKSVRGDHAGALATLDETDQLARQGTLPPYAEGGIAAWRARLALSAGDLASAGEWARQQHPSAPPTAVWLGDIESITRARVLLAQEMFTEAATVLEQARHSAETGKRMGSVIECLTLEALAAQAHGDGNVALASIGRALVLARQHQYTRVFIEEGAPMAQLFTTLRAAIRYGRAALEDSPSPDYLRRLLQAFDQHIQPGKSRVAPPPVTGTTQPLFEPLSERELEVLTLIAAGKSNSDIARELIVSLGTVKKHLNNIFGKLDAHSRTQAVARARQLGVLPV
jgi:LuxR family maltose regulon positive regulatory protein